MADVENIRQYPIQKSNEFIQKTSFMLSSQEYDILQYLIMQIKPNDKELKPYIFSIKEFCDVAGISDYGKNYERIKKSLKALADKSIWCDLPLDNKRTRLVRWIEDPWIDKGNGEIEIELKAYWKPYLLALKEYYTVTTLYDVLPMKSVYGKRMYELLNSYLVNNQSAYVEFEIDEIKKILLGEEDAKKKYKDTSNFRKKVLDPAMEDLQNFGQLDVKMELKRSGRSYRYVKFYIEPKSGIDKAKSSKNSGDYFQEKITKEV